MNISKSLKSNKSNRVSRLEVALYSAGRPVETEMLKRVVGTKSDKVLKKLVKNLAKIYSVRGSALEVIELPNSRVVMQLKTEYGSMVRQFTNRPLLTSGPLKTLSYIAYHQPVKQVKVIEDRGNHVYSHLRIMEEMGLITRERENKRGFIIKTTPYFGDYFGFSHNPNRSKLQLKMMFKQLEITTLENGNGANTSSRSMDERSRTQDQLGDEISEITNTSNQRSR